jgi:hypothetical protein
MAVLVHHCQEWHSTLGAPRSVSVFRDAELTKPSSHQYSAVIGFVNRSILTLKPMGIDSKHQRPHTGDTDGAAKEKVYTGVKVQCRNR